MEKRELSQFISSITANNIYGVLMGNLKTSAIILAAGAGTRMNSDKAKQLIDVCGMTVLERTLTAFLDSNLIDEIVVVTRQEELEDVGKLIASYSATKPIKVALGGSCRAESASNGFATVDEDCEFVAIHDAARCLITAKMIDKVVEKAHKCGAATAVCGVTDTVKNVDGSGKITATLPRERVFRAQTPQVFAKGLYSTALGSATDLSTVTDDYMLVESIGADVYAVDLGPTNIKITTPFDLTLAKNILKDRGEIAVDEVRIGHGYDVHRLVEGRKLIVGGVEIPHTKGLLGHSDADVLIHAVMDALLGAAALGDIGRHFPDTSEEFRGISSMHLLSRVHELIAQKGFKVVNVDATLVLQSPKVAGYIPKMVSNIAFALGVDESRVNVKATTEERLGFTGREEGAAAHAVAMLSVK